MPNHSEIRQVDDLIIRMLEKEPNHTLGPDLIHDRLKELLKSEYDHAHVASSIRSLIKSGVIKANPKWEMELCR